MQANNAWKKFFRNLKDINKQKSVYYYYVFCGSRCKNTPSVH